jgi:anti-anti-sigma factor
VKPAVDSPSVWIEAVSARERTTLAVSGEIDIATAQVLADHLHGAVGKYRWVTVDLRPTGFIDCSGLRVLAAARRRARDRGGDLDVIAGPRCARLIGLAKFDLPVAVDDSNGPGATNGSAGSPARARKFGMTVPDRWEYP